MVGELRSHALPRFQRTLPVLLLNEHLREVIHQYWDTMWTFLENFERLPVQPTDPETNMRESYSMTPIFKAYWEWNGEYYRGAKVFVLKMMDLPLMIQAFLRDEEDQDDCHRRVYMLWPRSCYSTHGPH